VVGAALRLLQFGHQLGHALNVARAHAAHRPGPRVLCTARAQPGHTRPQPRMRVVEVKEEKREMSE
jgi:hypothetical protein